MSDELFDTPQGNPPPLAVARAVMAAAADDYKAALALLDEQGPEAQPRLDSAVRAYDRAKATVMREELRAMKP